MLNLTIYHEHVSKISSIATQDKQAQRQCTQWDDFIEVFLIPSNTCSQI